MPSVIRFLPLVFVAAVAACSSTAPSSNPTGDGGGGGGDTGAPGDDAGGGGGDAGADGGSLDVQTSIGPIPLAAGEETTVCIVTQLTNPVDMWITDMHVNLAPGSHHLILYATTDPVNLTPTDCMPFQGVAFGSAEPLILVNKEQVDWTFPQGIALQVKAKQNVRIEAHYINVTQNMLQGMGTVNLHGVATSAAPSMKRADALFWGTTNISIPPNAAYSTGPLFQQGVAGMHFFTVTTHQHRLGTGIQVWESAKAGDMGTQIANDTDWSNPSWKPLPSEYLFDGTSGLTFQCNWNNTTNQTVMFGESALDEMCFVGGFYYPSQGFQVCIDNSCHFR